MQLSLLCTNLNASAVKIALPSNSPIVATQNRQKNLRGKAIVWCTGARRRRRSINKSTNHYRLSFHVYVGRVRRDIIYERISWRRVDRVASKVHECHL